MEGMLDLENHHLATFNEHSHSVNNSLLDKTIRRKVDREFDNGKSKLFL